MHDKFMTHFSRISNIWNFNYANSGRQNNMVVISVHAAVLKISFSLFLFKIRGMHKGDSWDFGVQKIIYVLMERVSKSFKRLDCF